MNVVIYDKKSLEIIARPVITNLEDFKKKSEFILSRLGFGKTHLE